jgi:von Willebrand factor type A domain
MFKFSTIACLLLGLTTLALAQGGCVGSTATTTGGRKIGIVIDTSGSMADTDPNNLRVAAGEAIVGSLITKADAGPNRSPDLVTVVGFSDVSTIIYPLGDPSTASFSGIDADGGTYIAGGVEAAIDELTKDKTSVTAGVTGIVVFTDGQDSAVSDLVDQLNRARGLGIRVSFGFLSPSDITSTQDPSILSAIISTGGLYSTIGDSTAQANFVNLVLSHGLTNTDQAGGSNNLLFPGLVTAGNVSATSGAETFTYDAVATEQLNFSVTSVDLEVFDLVLHDKNANKDVGSASTDSSGFASIQYVVSVDGELDLSVSTTNATAGLFLVSLTSSLNRTLTICGK